MSWEVYRFANLNRGIKLLRVIINDNKKIPPHWMASWIFNFYKSSRCLQLVGVDRRISQKQHVGASDFILVALTGELKTGMNIIFS